METLGAWISALAGTAVIGGAYSAGYEVRAFTVRECDVPILPAGASSLKVLHLSDIHMTPSQKKKQEWLKSLAALSPDFVVVTGDFLAHMKSVPVVLDALAPLLSIPGAFVFGSNDYYAPSMKNPVRYLFEDDGTRIHGDELPWGELKAALESHGWIDLTHVRRDVRIGDVAFEFRGVDDAHLERDDYSTIAGAVASTVVGVGVSHAPYLRVLDGMSSDGIDLIFAGHTHGGQLRIPFYGSLVTNCDLDNARSRGLSRHKSSWLHVSAGIGTNPYTPFRFACRPEATLLHLVAKN